ncbi:MAG: alcohol dehydrogenase catalytic domain-containing protein [Candidatus Latescibacteria bacterium]|nr:alcohol dehydrogenase catalytic domain-containing protein [Candidatus Latescibacterota bacterium]
MRAVRKIKPGPDNIALCDIPEPGLQHPTDIKIAVQCGGLCGTDLHIKHGGYGFDPPVTLCHELAGDIVEIGKDVQHLKIGDRVTVMPSANGACGHCRYCQTGEFFFCPQRNSIGSKRDGGFAEYCVVPANLAFSVPNTISYDAAALVEPLACCIKAISLNTHITPNDTVFITGPGPIGLMCATLAQLSGGQVVLCGTEHDTDRLTKAKELGIKHTLNINQIDPVQYTRDLTNGHGADIVIDCAGAASAIAQCLEAVRPLGIFTQVALLDHPINIDWGKIIYKQLHVQGFIAQSWESWHKALDLVTTNTIDLTQFVSHRLPLEKWEQAFNGAEQQQGLKYLLIP